jgi:rhodanese-related sulfurtransferase
MDILSRSPRWLLSCALLLSLCVPFALARAETVVLLNPGDQAEESRVEAFNEWKNALDQALLKVDSGKPTVRLSTDATGDLQATRSRLYEVYVAPAHVIGSAIRYGYQPVLGYSRPVQVVLVALANSGVTNLAQAQGKVLGLPMQDSIVTYLVQGEFHASNTTLKRQFASLYQTRYQEALLICLKLRRCDVVAVEKSLFDRWLAAGEKLVAVMQTREVPGLSVALRDDSKINPVALAAAIAAALPDEEVRRMNVDDFKYVSTLGYFTPRSLPGVTVVDAPAVVALMKQGARYIDTRNDVEYKAAHVAGAVLIPYVEKSPKDPDYDASKDQFDLTALGSDKAALLVFACNGPECWKSYKASRAAIKAGFSRVHWFRGGVPEWRSANLPLKIGA